MSQSPEHPRPFDQMDADSFVARALHKASPKEMSEDICIDYAYAPGSGANRFAGGDLALMAAGYAAIDPLKAKGLNISREMVEDAVFKVLGKGNIEEGKKKFHYHTDEAHWNQEADLLTRLSGCGFLRNILENDRSFFSETDRGHFSALMTQIGSIKGPKVLARTPDMHPRGVFIVQRVKDLSLPDIELGRANNLLSFDESMTQSTYALDSAAYVGSETKLSYAYGYNLGAANARLREVAQCLMDELAPGGLPFANIDQYIYESLKEAEDVQRDRTVATLAGHLPVFGVYVNPYSSGEELRYKVVRQ